MKDCIVLHPKYGVNPTISICPFCGKEMGIVMLGNSYKEEAPKEMIIDPTQECDECAKLFKQGILFVEIKNQDNPTPLRYALIKTEAAKELFNNSAIPKNVVERTFELGRCYVEEGFLKHIGIEVNNEK